MSLYWLTSASVLRRFNSHKKIREAIQIFSSLRLRFQCEHALNPRFDFDGFVIEICELSLHSDNDIKLVFQICRYFKMTNS